MTTLYYRATSSGNNLHLSPIAAASFMELAASGAWADSNDGFDLTFTLYHVTGGVETSIGTSSSQHYETDSSATEYFTHSLTVASHTGLQGGTALKSVHNISSLDGNRSVTFYSGPLVATGISSGTWTIGAGGGNYYGYEWGVCNVADTYISGITLTGSPSSIRLYPVGTISMNTPTTPQGAWDSTANKSSRRLNVKIGASPGTSTVMSGTVANYDSMAGNWTGLPLVQAVSFAANAPFKACAGAYEGNADVDATSHYHVWVAYEVATTKRGTLVTDYCGGNEWATSAATAGRYVETTQSALSASAGDRIICEFGIRSQGGTSRSNTYYLGGTSATDLTEGADASSYPQWIEVGITAGGTNHPLGGTVAGTGAVDGHVHLRNKLAGTADCSGAFAGALTLIHQDLALAGSVDGSGAFTGTTKIENFLHGTVAGTSPPWTGDLTVVSGVAAPATATLTVSGEHRLVSWDAVTDAESYIVERQIDDGAWVQVMP